MTTRYCTFYCLAIFFLFACLNCVSTFFSFFFFNDPPPPEIYPLPLHDALPISYLVRSLGRGIAPPAGGVGFALWISWEVAVASAAMALVFTAAALVRGPREPDRVPWTLPAGCGWAALAALGGLWLWQPYGAWPEWYTFVWLPALVGVLVPAPRRWAVLGIATV